MSFNFEVRISDELKGLGIFANKSYQDGDVIFEEKPIVAAQFCWNEAYGYLACHHCMKPLETAEENVRRLSANSNIVLPYPNLETTNKDEHRVCEFCAVQYCSEECKQTALKLYHNFLCFGKLPGLAELCEKWKVIHYPPETTSIMLLAKIIATIEQAEDKEAAMKLFLEFSHGTADEKDGMLLKLLGAENDEKLKTLHSQLLKSLPVQYAHPFVTEDGVKSLCALIGRNGQGIGTSVFSEYLKNVEQQEMSNDDREKFDSLVDKIYQAMDQHVGTFLNCEGSGLYKLQRCINHSCIPNAIVTFPYSNSTVVLVAKGNIEAGEEICISYIDDCLLERSRHSRNKYLRDYYLFECRCDKCLSQIDEPDVTSEEESDEDESMED